MERLPYVSKQLRYVNPEESDVRLKWYLEYLHARLMHIEADCNKTCLDQASPTIESHPTPPLSPTNLPRRHRLNPAHSNIDSNDDRTNNPDGVPITRTIPEDNRKHNAAQISTSACESRHHAVGLRVHVRYERECQTVRAGQEEHEHDGNERDHGPDGFGVEEADEQHHGAGTDAVDVQKRFLRPHGVGVVVCDVADDSA
jgi:hypothetical protein